MKITATSFSTPLKAREILEQRDEEQLQPRQEMALEYLRRNLQIQDDDSFAELKDELIEIDSLKEKHVLKILEVLPTHEEEVNALFSKERVKLDDSDIQSIIEICSSFED